MSVTRFVQRMELAPVRYWRVVIIVYAIALTIGTHWPKLRVGGPGGFPIDKVLHVVAFAGAAGLLMLARPAGSHRTAFSIANVALAASMTLVWAALDEWTQSAAALDRFARLDDYIADAIGVAISTAIAGLFFSRAGRQKTRQQSGGRA